MSYIGIVQTTRRIIPGRPMALFIYFALQSFHRHRVVRALLVLSNILVAGGDLSGQTLPTATHRAILIARDTRDTQAIRRFLNDAAPEARSLAALSAGSLQDTSHIRLLAELMDDASASVRRSTAFALGQMNAVVDSAYRRYISDELLKRLDGEIDGATALQIAEALGKVGDAVSLAGLMKPLTQRRPFPIEWEIALSVGRYAYRNIKSKEATSYVVRLLDSSTGRDRWRAAYAIMRIADPDLLGEHISRIAAAAQSQDPEVRMHIAPALGRFFDRRVVELTLLRMIQEETDWRVRVNAIKGLRAAQDSMSEGPGLAVIQAMDDVEEHVSLTALVTVRSLKLREQLAGTVRTSLVGIIDNNSGRYTPRQQKEAAVSLATIGGAAQYPLLRAKKDQSRIPVIAYVEALGAIPTDEARIELVSFVRPDGPRLTRTALEALQSSINRSPPSLRVREQVRAAIVSALSFNDPAVLTTAAALLADSLLADTRSVPELLLALQRLKSPDDAEPMMAIIQTLGALKDQVALPTLVSLVGDADRTVALEAASALEKITGRQYRQQVTAETKTLHTIFDWELLEWLERNPEVRVRTGRGDFTIVMFPDEAPFTCLSFATLIHKNFFDNLTFHRVVPNFVVQGGDPGGDGWGGPGYSIRSEFGLAHFGRGYVGVASSGKDTEGSQFFITHSAQPHLDGRYTIFGRVISGMGVVDRLQVGDTIEEMRFTAEGQFPGQR